MFANFATTNNYETPPAGSTITAFYQIFPTDVGVMTNINPPSGAPATNSWQGLIVDARNMTVPCDIFLGVQGLFSLTILPGTYQSFQIPAFSQPIFRVANSGPDLFSATAGTSINLMFTNYPILPQSFQAGVPIIGLTSISFTNATPSFNLNNSFRFVDISSENASGDSFAFAVIIKNISGNELFYNFLLAPDSSFQFTVWKSDTTPIQISTVEVESSGIATNQSVTMSLGV
jgi:hypothetical protein